MAFDVSVSFEGVFFASFATALTSVSSATLSAGTIMFPSLSTVNPLSAGTVHFPSLSFVAVTVTGFVCPSGV